MTDEEAKAMMAEMRASESGEPGPIENRAFLMVVFNALMAAIEENDSRWRPMFSAPRDGTVIELNCIGDHDMEAAAGVYIAKADKRAPEGDSHRAHWRGVDRGVVFFDRLIIGWRPAHLEWNEETG